jgi:hypothetical protein
MFDGIYNSLKVGGLALFGVVGLGYPEYSTDYFRFTSKGFDRLLTNKYMVISKDEVGKEPVEYLFYLCKKI